MPKFYDRAYRGSWNGLTVISISIGYKERFSLTPLQIANLAATIANRGHYITPHIVKEIQDNELDSIYRFPHSSHHRPPNMRIRHKGDARRRHREAHREAPHAAW